MIEQGRTQTIRNKSGNRSFGLVMAGAFLIVSLVPLVRGNPVHPWGAAAAGVFLAAALLFPAALSPLNRLWFRFGLLLHAITSPLLLGALFYLVFTPIGLLRRLLGGDPLRRKPDPGRGSYWIERSPPGPKAETLRDQF